MGSRIRTDRFHPHAVWLLVPLGLVAATPWLSPWSQPVERRAPGKVTRSGPDLLARPAFGAPPGPMVDIREPWQPAPSAADCALASSVEHPCGR